MNEICEDKGKSWGEVTLNLSEYTGQVVQIQLAGITEMYVYTLFDAIKVTDSSELSAEDLVSDGISISTGKGSITVSGTNGEKLTVVSTDGMSYFSGKMKSQTEISVPAGLYLVKAGTITRKVLVK